MVRIMLRVADTMMLVVVQKDMLLLDFLIPIIKMKGVTNLVTLIMVLEKQDFFIMEGMIQGRFTKTKLHKFNKTRNLYNLSTVMCITDHISLRLIYFIYIQTLYVCTYVHDIVSNYIFFSLG